MPARGEPPAWTPLPPLPAEAATAILAPPRLPLRATRQIPIFRRAAAAAVPIRLTVPTNGGRLLLARALHALFGRGGPLIALSGRRPPLDRLPADATLYVDAARLASVARPALEALLDDGRVWVLAGVEPGVVLEGPMATRLGAVTLDIPPLTARVAELPELAAAILAALARRAGLTTPSIEPAALAHLRSHRWPGDLAELEAVLARAFVLATGDTIELDHLVLEPAPAPPVSEPPTAPAAAAGPDASLDFLLAELAHELRNPLVTIKTFAQHLPALLEDSELRTRFAGLADEAIGRMDALLENVLAYARLPPPRIEGVDLQGLIERVMAEVEPEREDRHVRVRQATSPGAQCAGDPEHLAYALRNLLAGVMREVAPREELALDATANGVVTLRFAPGGAAVERLRRLAAPGSAAEEAAALADPTLLPLAFRLARTVLERNGGGFAVVPAGETTTLVVQLPVARPAAQNE
jgi:signal transduction histidine kinase